MLKPHPVAEIIPEMSSQQFDQLVADIRQNGLREPVLLHPDGSIIDGRHRYRACLESERGAALPNMGRPGFTDRARLEPEPPSPSPG